MERGAPSPSQSALPVQRGTRARRFSHTKECRSVADKPGPASDKAFAMATDGLLLPTVDLGRCRVSVTESGIFSESFRQELNRIGFGLNPVLTLNPERYNSRKTGPGCGPKPSQLATRALVSWVPVGGSLLLLKPPWVWCACVDSVPDFFVGTGQVQTAKPVT